MADVISLSSGSDQEDSDIELVGMYSDTERTTETIPFIRGRWVNLAAYSSFVIDLAAHPWALPPPRRRRRRDPTGPVEVVDLSDENSLSNDSGKEPLSPLSKRGNATLKDFLNKTSLSPTPQTRGSGSLRSSPEKQEQLKRNSKVLEDVLEPCQGLLLRRDSSTKPTDLEGNERGSDRDVPNSHAKSPSPSRSKDTEENGETGASGQLEPLEGRTVSEHPISTTQTSDVPHHASEPRQSPPSEDAYHKPETQSTFSADRPPQLQEPQNGEESGSPHTPLDLTLSLSPQSPGGPSPCPDEVDDPLKSYDYAPYESQETELYSPTLSPFEWSFSPYRASEDLTPCLHLGDLDDSNVSPASDTEAEDLGTRQLETVPCPLSEPCSPYAQSPGPDHQPPPCPPLPLQPTPDSTSPPPTPSSGVPPQSRSIESQPNRSPSPTPVVSPARESPECQLAEADLAVATSPASYGCSIHSNAPLSPGRTEEMDTEPPGPESPGGAHRAGLGLGGQSSLLWVWKERCDEGAGEETEAAVEKVKAQEVQRGVSQEDRRYVCPIQLRKLRPLMAGTLQCLEDVEEEDDGFGAPEQLCRQSLSLVYSTMEESYPEGTLQLLSDLLHPRFYPPKDITVHLLRDILLDHQAPRFLCLEAYTLLMRTQRHHPADVSTVPWDWELLTSVMAEQEHPKRHSGEQLTMLMQYVLQTLEDDFRLKLSLGHLHHSIAKATLSSQAGRASDVIKWLMTVIMKSTGDKNSREKGEHLKMVFVLQKMLSLALEVDCSPAISSSKLSQRLFHTCISMVPLREHRMLLLETMESRLLKCNLLEHLLEHTCPQKTPIPMSLGLLLHFLKHCTLTPDPTDGVERWRRWDELVQLLWMLLLSHEEVVRGHLRSPVPERAGYSHAPYQVVNTMSRSDVREAVDNFLSRSQTDLGQSLPSHVQESLTYLQQHLMDSCQH